MGLCRIVVDPFHTLLYLGIILITCLGFICCICVCLLFVCHSLPLVRGDQESIVVREELQGEKVGTHRLNKKKKSNAYIVSENAQSW